MRTRQTHYACDRVTPRTRTRGRRQIEEMSRNPPRQSQLRWSIIPETHRASPFSPVINLVHAYQTFGPPECARKSAERQRRLADPTGAAAARAASCAAGDGSCANPDAEELDGCIPAYRGAFTFIYYVCSNTWFATGAVCIGRYSSQCRGRCFPSRAWRPEAAWVALFVSCVLCRRNSHFDEELMLMDAGMASSIDEDVATKYGWRLRRYLRGLP
jgi:hypothetical protein